MPDTSWPTVPIGKIASDIRDGTHGTHPRVESGIPFLSAKNIKLSGKLLWSDADQFINENEYKLITSTFSPKQGDLLVTVVGTLGRTAIFSGEKVAFQRSVAFIRPNNHILPEYLLQISKDCHFLRQMEQRSNATAQTGLYLRELGKITLPLPPLNVQGRIAKILSTIDEAIEQTEALISKMRQVKAGLMHDLFTRGVTPDGRLRPPREQAPQLYKESPLGWIPKEWHLKKCAEICLSVIDCKNRTPPPAPAGHPVIRTPNVRNGEFVWKDLAFTDPKSYREWTARGRPIPGDIVITREAPVGETCLIPSELGETCLGQRMMLYRPDPALVVGSYLVQALQSQQVQKRLDIISGGSTVGHVRVGDIRNLQIPWAELQEQESISSKLEAVNEQITHLRKEMIILGQIKSGLMQDLLTGRVPVTVAEETPEVPTDD